MDLMIAIASNGPSDEPLAGANAKFVDRGPTPARPGLWLRPSQSPVRLLPLKAHMITLDQKHMWTDSKALIRQGEHDEPPPS